MHRQHLRGVLEAVAQSAHFPDTSSAPALDLDAGGTGGTPGGTTSTPEALQAREAEAAAAERRQELFVLFRNAAKVGRAVEVLAAIEQLYVKRLHLPCPVGSSSYMGAD